MRRLQTVMAAVLPLCAEGAEIFFQSEYRRDALDAEEEIKDFWRTRFRIFAGTETSAGAAVSYQRNTKLCTWTFNAVYDDVCSPVSVIIGNYYAQSGSGLLYGKIRPWNPDPFSAAAELSDAHGFTPCNSANPSFAFNGAALTFYPSGKNGNSSARIGVSRTLRYAEEDTDHTSSTHASMTTLLSHSDRKYPYTKALWCDSLTGAFLLRAGDYSTAEFSALSLSCRDIQGKRISWARYETGGRWSAVEQMQGFSVFAGYNDGVLRMFAETAVNANRLSNEGSGTLSAKAYAAQGEIAFTSKLFCGSVKGKSISSNYGSPFFSTYGSRSPSQGLFLAMKLSPSRSLKLNAETSADKKTSVSQYSTEPSASFKESASLYYEPFRHFAVELSHSQTGASYRFFPDKSRIKGETMLKFKNVKISASSAQQRSAARTATTASAGIQCRLLYRHTFSASGEYLRTKKTNPVYSSALSEGGIPLFTAGRRLRDAGGPGGRGNSPTRPKNPGTLHGR